MGALALLSIADRDKPLLGRLATGLARAGYRFAATAGTPDGARHARPRRASRSPSSVRPDEDGGTPIIELIESGEVRLVVNTPTPQSGAVRDAAEIRLAATAEGILCLTAIETAVAAAEALDPAVVDRLAEVRPLGEWVPERPRTLASARRSAPLRCVGVTTIACPSDHSVRVVSPTMSSASGTWRRRTARASASADRAVGPGDLAQRNRVPRPGADDVPADDRDELKAPRDGARQPGGRRLELADPEQVPAEAERVGQRDQEALAVEQDERQVVGDEVADRDRHEPGGERPYARRSG